MLLAFSIGVIAGIVLTLVTSRREKRPDPYGDIALSLGTSRDSVIKVIYAKLGDKR